MRLDGATPAVDSPPPTLGQHSREILAELGYTAADIDALEQEGAL
jgi:formyl-CoA transferase